MTELKPRRVLRGEDRTATAARARTAYEGGESIRGVADRDLVVESGAALRSRGGANRTKRGDA